MAERDSREEADLESGEALESGETLAAPVTPGAGAASGSDDGGPDGTLSVDTWRVGQTLAGRYTLLDRLGRGGMSEVYLARHELLKKTVAVKVLRPDIAVTKQALSRFHREAMAAASVGNAHIVDITDYGFTDDGNAFIVMERLIGADLRTELTNRGALPAGRSVAIIRQVLRGLAAAHAQGIVHRDLKAENVFLCDQEERGEFVKVLDFGISKVTQPLDDSPEDSLVRTSTGAVMGTPQYIAPEQAHGDRDIDHRADIYSAGVMLYEMLTGELPFSGKSALDVVMKHVLEAPQPPRERRPDLDIPPELDRLVLKAMAKAREDRFADAEAMRDALPEPTSLPGGFSSMTLAAPSIAPRPAYGLYVVLLAVVFGLGAVAWLWVLPDREEGYAVGEVGDASAVAVGAAPRTTARPRRQTGGGDAGLPVASAAAEDAASSSEGVAVVSEVRVGAVEPADAGAGDASATVTVRLQVLPTTARIFEGGKEVGRGELRRELRRGSPPLALQVRAPGYEPLPVELGSKRSQLRRVSLRRRGGGTRSGTRSGTEEGTRRAGTGDAGVRRVPPKTGPSDLHRNPYLKRRAPADRR